ncbi:MAG: hypothetical protein LBO00_08750 [Zoogloeaceae bacterium]|nr:hypothetical protein [Zoogloeaceae bacterium]
MMDCRKSSAASFVLLLGLVQKIAFRRGEAAEGLVTVTLSRPDVGIQVYQQRSILMVDFQNVLLPENLRRRLDVITITTGEKDGRFGIFPATA